MKRVEESKLLFLDKKLFLSILMTLCIIFLIMTYKNGIKTFYLYKHYINKCDFLIENIFY